MEMGDGREFRENQETIMEQFVKCILLIIVNVVSVRALAGNS